MATNTSQEARECGPRRRQALEVHHRGGQADLNPFVGQSAARGSTQTMLGLGLSVNTFDTPSMTVVHPPHGFVPVGTFASGAKQSFVPVSNHNRSGTSGGGDTPGTQWTRLDVVKVASGSVRLIFLALHAKHRNRI